MFWIVLFRFFVLWLKRSNHFEGDCKVFESISFGFGWNWG